MKVQNMVIERRPGYDDDYPNMLVGLVQIQGLHGKMEVKLFNKTLSQIFALIKEDVERTAKYNASQAGDAISDAENESPLLENMSS